MKLRVAIAALALCLVQALPGGTYGTIATPESDKQLQAMETKFFEHDFSKEAEEYRLQRLEKFAFGQTGEGNVDVRLKKLVQVINLHPNLVQPKPQQTVAAAPPAARPQYSRSLDDNAAQSEHDKMKWVEDYRPKQAYQEPMQSVVPASQRMSEDDSDLDAVEAGLAEKSTPFMPKQPPAISTNFPQVAQSLDPAVLAAAPPDHHARMLTRVAWCEEQIFHRTFPELHLPARLHQLNAEVFPTDHSRSDLDLMDRLDLIVREVVMQQHPPIAYGK
jgi:hypothetical protein